MSRRPHDMAAGLDCLAHEKQRDRVGQSVNNLVACRRQKCVEKKIERTIGSPDAGFFVWAILAKRRNRRHLFNRRQQMHERFEQMILAHLDHPTTDDYPMARRTTTLFYRLDCENCCLILIATHRPLSSIRVEQMF